MTKDPATWTHGKLLMEVYRLKGLNDELVEALKLTHRKLKSLFYQAVEGTDGDKWIKEIEKALKNAGEL